MPSERTDTPRRDPRGMTQRLRRLNEGPTLAECLRKWADVVSIPSGTFLNEDLREAADAIETLTDMLRKADGVLKPFGELTVLPNGTVAGLERHWFADARFVRATIAPLLPDAPATEGNGNV